MDVLPIITNASKKIFVIASLIVFIGFLLTWQNSELPIVRNGAIYTQMVLNFIESDFNLFEISQNQESGYGKPIGFALFSLPWVLVCGPQIGMLTSSALSTVLLLVVSIAFFKRFNKKVGLPQRVVSLEIGLVFFNALVLYQFWSAYPDPLFATLFLWSFIQLDQLVEKKLNASVASFTLYLLTILGTICVKYYGLVLLIIHPFYLLIHSKELLPIIKNKKALIKLALLSTLLVGILLASRMGWNPFIYLGPKAKGGYEVYREGLATLKIPLSRNLFCFFTFLGVTLSFLVIFVFHPRNWNKGFFILASVPLLYIVGLLVYPHAYWNMRFFIPILPFAALFIVHGLHFMKRKTALLFLGGHLFISLVFIAYFNHVGTHRLLKSLVQIKNRKLATALDSLRMDEQITQKTVLEMLNRIPKGQRLFIVKYHYSSYGKVLHGFYEKLGFLDTTRIQIRYVEAYSDLLPIQGTYFIFAKTSEGWHEFKEKRSVTYYGGKNIYIVENAHDTMPDD